MIKTVPPKALKTGDAFFASKVALSLQNIWFNSRLNALRALW
jgi:hypothetical protein